MADYTATVNNLLPSFEKTYPGITKLVSEVPGAYNYIGSAYARTLISTQSPAYAQQKAATQAKTIYSDPVAFVKNQLRLNTYQYSNSALWGQSPPPEVKPLIDSDIKYLQGKNVDNTQIRTIVDDAVNQSSVDQKRVISYFPPSEGNDWFDKLLPVALAFAAPAIGAAIAAELGVSAAVGTAIASTALQTAAGADPSTAIQNAITSAIVQTGSTAVAQQVNSAMTSLPSDTAAAISNAAGSALSSAAITAASGGSTEEIIKNAVAGAAGSGVSSATGDKVLGAATTGGLTGGLEGALTGAAGAYAKLPPVEDAKPVPVEEIKPTTGVVFSADQSGNALVLNQDGSVAQVQVPAGTPAGAAVQIDPTTNTAQVVQQAPYAGTPTEVAEVPRFELRGMAEPDVPTTSTGVESTTAGRFELPEVPAGGEPLSQVTPVVVGQEEPVAVTPPDRAIIDLIEPPMDFTLPSGEAAAPITPAQAGGLEPISSPTEAVSAPVEGAGGAPGEVVAGAPGTEETLTPPAPQEIPIPDQITQVTGGAAGVPVDTGFVETAPSMDQQIMELTGITPEAQPITPEPTPITPPEDVAVTEPTPTAEEPVTEEAAAPAETIAPEPFRPEFFVAGGVAPRMQARTPALAQALQAPFYGTLPTTGLTSYRGAGEIESSETGGKRRNVWNEASLRLKDALGI